MGPGPGGEAKAAGSSGPSRGLKPVSLPSPAKESDKARRCRSQAGGPSGRFPPGTPPLLPTAFCRSPADETRGPSPGHPRVGPTPALPAPRLTGSFGAAPLRPRNLKGGDSVAPEPRTSTDFVPSEARPSPASPPAKLRASTLLSASGFPPASPRRLGRCCWSHRATGHRSPQRRQLLRWARLPLAEHEQEGSGRSVAGTGMFHVKHYDEGTESARAEAQVVRCSSISTTSPPDSSDALRIHSTPSTASPRRQRSHPLVSR